MIWGFHFSNFRKPIYLSICLSVCLYVCMYACMHACMRMFCQDLRIFLGRPCFSHDFSALFFPCLSWFQIFVVNFPPGMIPKGVPDRGQDLDARAAGGPSGNLWNFPYFPWKSPDQKTPEVKPWVLGTCWNMLEP